MINKTETYANIRKNFGSLSQAQVEGFEAIINQFYNIGLIDLRYLAYILATVWHETAKTMQPISEFGKGKDRDYGKRLRINRKLYTITKNIFYGRGHTQNTWIDNYEKLTKSNNEGWDFVNNPDLLLEMKPSIWATFYAMTTGLYTGKKLSDYFSKTSNDPVGARKIINGQDKAQKIAEYYHLFLKSIS